MHPMLLLPLLPFTCAAAVESASVLFIGNSLTFTNDLPQMLAGLASSGGLGEIAYASEVVGGASLKQHWLAGKAMNKLQSRRWTWVVIQEVSDGTVRHPDDFATYGRLFIDAVKANGSRPVLYQTWAKLGEMDTQVRITAAYHALGVATGAQIVPAGLAFAGYRATHGDGSLFTDNRHPTPAGTYLAACCFYQALFGKDPLGLPGEAARLDDSSARDLQRIASSVALPR